ncbi:MAG: ATP synthase subunit a [bacterium ADurb.Bin400]|nr:MAG: ATP synthase subunit a [bacterium ADurb.Bin400]
MSDIHISLAAEKIGHLGPLPITNSMVMGWTASLILITLGILATRKSKLVPSGLQNLIEIIVEFLFNTANEVIGDRNNTKKFFPLIATIFLFVLTANWLGIIPGVGTIGIHEIDHGKEIFVPILRPGNADLNTTLALAITAVFSVQIFGIVALGFWKYAGKFINFKDGPIHFGVGLLELISEISKMISFSFRLFGNIFAGEVLLTVIAVIMPFIVPLPFYGLELFVGLVQALVFTMLTLVFIKIATADHAEH